MELRELIQQLTMCTGSFEGDDMTEQRTRDTIAARWARTILIDGVEVFGVFLQLQVYGASKRKRDAEAGRAGREDTVGLPSERAEYWK